MKTLDKETAKKWKACPKDYKGITNGVRTVLTLDRLTGGTVLCPLDDAMTARYSFSGLPDPYKNKEGK